MTKLKKKIFLLIFTILTVCVLSFIVVFNVQKYFEQVHQIKNDLEMASNSEKKEPKKEALNKKIKFADKNIYTIILNNDNSIIDVINMGNSSNNIKKYANTLLKKDINNKHIGFLYFDNYSYVFESGKYLTILDNSLIRKSLINSLYICVCLFIILEIFIYIISKIITNNITKPVLDSFEKQKQFVADASHELKTPLSVITASSEMFYKYPDEKKWLVNIKNEANRMNYLINTLLKLTESENNNLYNFTEKDLSKIIELSVLTFEGKAFEKGVKLNYKIEENIKFKVDENSIKQLIEILLDNATRHAYKNSTIDVFLNKINNQIELKVINVGDKIPKEDEKKYLKDFIKAINQEIEMKTDMVSDSRLRKIL